MTEIQPDFAAIGPMCVNKIIVKAQMIESASQLTLLLQETDELIAILFTSVETAKKSKER